MWLENSGGQAKLHFGEYNDNLRETSPGLLDKFKGVPVLEQSVAGAKQRVEGQLTKEAFTYTAAANAETLFADAATGSRLTCLAGYTAKCACTRSAWSRP